MKTSDVLSLILIGLGAYGIWATFRSQQNAGAVDKYIALQPRESGTAVDDYQIPEVPLETFNPPDVPLGS
jgi:hypothetical protein